MSVKTQYQSLLATLLLKLAIVVVDANQINELQQDILEIGIKNPQYLRDAVYLANSLTNEGDILVTTFVEDQLPSGKRKY